MKGKRGLRLSSRKESLGGVASGQCIGSKKQEDQQEVRGCSIKSWWPIGGKSHEEFSARVES